MAEMLASRLIVSAVGSIFAVLFLVMRKILPRSAGLVWRKTIGILLLVVLLFPTPIVSPISVYSILSNAASDQVQWLLTDRSVPDINLQGSVITSTNVLPTIDDIAPPSGFAAKPVPFPRIDWIAAIYAIWAVGTLAMLATDALRGAFFAKKVRGFPSVEDPRMVKLLQKTMVLAGLRKQPGLVAAPIGPAVYGYRAPRILFPPDVAAADDKTVQLLLLHECLHIRRRDTFRLLALLIVKALYWWNPLIRMAYAVLREDIELCCDNAVLRRIDPEQHTHYAKALIHAAAAPGPAIGAAGSPMKERIVMVKNYRKTKWWISIGTAALCCILAVMFLTVPQKKTEAAVEMLTPQPVLEASTDYQNTEAHLEKIIGDYQNEGFNVYLADNYEGSTSGIHSVLLHPESGEVVTLIYNLSADEFAYEHKSMLDVSAYGDMSLLSVSYDSNSMPYIARQGVTIYSMPDYIFASNVEIPTPLVIQAGANSMDAHLNILAGHEKKVIATLSDDCQSAMINSMESLLNIRWSEMSAWASYGGGEIYRCKDVRTGMEFDVMRSTGTSSMTVEPATAEDTAILLDCLGGAWAWDARPVRIQIGRHWYPASMIAWPHGEDRVADNGITGGITMSFYSKSMETDGAKWIEERVTLLEAIGIVTEHESETRVLALNP